jgi:hypothetical protein
MKNTFLIFAIVVMASLVLSHKASAQVNLEIHEEELHDLTKPAIIKAWEDAMKTSNTIHVNEDALKNFHKEFPAAVNVSWYPVIDGYIASFTETAAETKVAYDKKGRLHHILSFYGEEKLPRDVRHMVKSTYYDHAIMKVAEIHFNNPDEQAIYIVYIQDKKGVKILTVSDYEILSVNDFSGN